LLCALTVPLVLAAQEQDVPALRLAREIWLDTARQRHVNVRIALPPRGAAQAQGAAMPVVLFSAPQGFRYGGHVDAYEPLAEMLLKRGVVMVMVFHYDLLEQMGRNERFADIYPGIRTGARNDAPVDRFEDCLFVLDQLSRINAERRDGWPTLDLSKLAVIGHSSGTLTAMHLSGLPVRDRDGKVFAVHRDPRVKAFVVYSYPFEYSAPGRADVKQVGAVAGLHVAGTEDHPDYRNSAYRYIDGAPQYWLVAKGDHSVGEFGSEALILQVTGDFIDAYLNGNAGARGRLSLDTLKSHRPALKQFLEKPPSYWPRLDQRDFAAWARESLPWGKPLHVRAIAYQRTRDRPAK
jgi:hypothetical protein